jgi:hypothetical protein
VDIALRGDDGARVFQIRKTGAPIALDAEAADAWTDGLSL